jgi:hypothetical protein
LMSQGVRCVVRWRYLDNISYGTEIPFSDLLAKHKAEKIEL